MSSEFTLYELSEAYLRLKELEDDNNVDEDIKNALDNVEDTFYDKADNIVTLVKRLDADIDMISTEQKRLQAKKKSIENRKKSLLEYLENAMIATDQKKFKTKRFSYNIQKNPASLRILSEDKIEDEYKIIATKIDKTKLKKDIKDGKKIDYAELVQSESLRIR